MTKLTQTLIILIFLNCPQLAALSYSSGRTSIINIDSKHYSLLDRKFIFEKENETRRSLKKDSEYLKNANLNLLKSKPRAESAKKLKSLKPVTKSIPESGTSESKQDWSQFYRESDSTDLNVNARLLP